ncbi:hypothetical protein EON63_02530 [archaeon]|nr:MAG: hypothetical protein EON63_02530 [archaeon]
MHKGSQTNSATYPPHKPCNHTLHHHHLVLPYHLVPFHTHYYNKLEYDDMANGSGSAVVFRLDSEHMVPS